MIRTQMKIYIETSKKERLEALATTLNKPVNTVVNELIDTYIKEQVDSIIVEMWDRGMLIKRGEAYAQS